MDYRDQASLSDAQRAVLFEQAPRALVAAGAGSGKTKLLVAYFVHCLLDLGLKLEDLAAVTFTRKAGSELAERIRKELVRFGQPELARSLDVAAIGTIHGLCRRLLAAEALKAGVDPSFGVLEADAEQLIKKEVWRQAWAKVVEQASEEDLQVLASRGDGMEDLVLPLYDRLRGLGRQSPEVQITAAPSDPGARQALVEACDHALAQGNAVPKIGSDLRKSLDRLNRCRLWLEQVEREGDAHCRVAETSEFFPSRSTPSAKPYLEPVEGALIRYRQTLAQTELGRLVDVVNKLLSVFHELYESHKQARGVLDFSDLEVRAKLMLDDSRGARGPVIASHILVDEFQDTNELQCAIIDGLRPEKQLMVGDARQSIYSFRGADVGVFMRRMEDGGIAQHRLDTNYRSRPELIAFVNHLFGRPSLFADRFGPLQAGRDGGCSAGDEPRGTAGPTEILVVDRAAPDGEEGFLTKQQAEAYVVADTARRLVDERGWSKQDIVVLLPQLTQVNEYQDALQARGLEVYVVRGKGYYSQDEIADILALLRLLLNPHDDLALLTVLRSPLVEVSDDCLYQIGRAARGRRALSLWDVVRDGALAGMLETADESRLQGLQDRLDRLRLRIGRPGLSRLIDDAVTACDYDLCLLAAPHGKRRFANVRKLMRMAAEYEDLEGPDLKGFVTLIGSLSDMGDDEGNAPSLAEGENVVRIMTVHQAKGLEFNVVILAGLHKDPNPYKAPEILVGSDGTMAARLRVDKSDPDRPGWGPVEAIIADQQRRAEDEDIRLLYVAMTRARDQLVLVGSRKAKDDPDAARIGTIVTALGLDHPPLPGEVVPLEDIHAVVKGVAACRPDDGAVASAGPSERARVAASPCLLDVPSSPPAARQVSFSALSAYDRCPQRFYLERVLGLGPELPARALGFPTDGDGAADDGEPAADGLLDGDELHSGIEVGLLVHTLLRRLDLAGPEPEGAGLKALAQEIAREQGLAAGSRVVDRAAALTAAFWTSDAARATGLAQASKETPFFFVHGGVAVNGVIDLLVRSDERWLIADYKSNALNGRSPEEAAATYHLQAAMYCLAALKAGASAVRMEFLFLERPDEPVGFDYGRGDLAGLEKRLEHALSGLEAGDFHPQFGPGCASCGIKNVCDTVNGRRLVVE